MSKEQLLQQLKTIIDAAGENATLIKQEAVDLLELQAQITQNAAQTNGAQPGLTEALAKLKISQSTKMPKFVKTDNFSRYCERFQEYVYIAKINDQNLNMFFLQNLDDETYSQLRNVELTNEQKADAQLFCPIYKRAIYADMSISLKNEVMECRQKIDENIADYAFRLREKGMIAYSNTQDAEDNCLIAFLRGVKDPQMRRKLNEASSLSTFKNAITLAKRLEKVNEMLNEEPEINSILKESTYSFKPEREKPDHPRNESYNDQRYSKSESPNRASNSDYHQRRDRSSSRDRYRSRPRYRDSNHVNQRSDNYDRSRRRSSSRDSRESNQSRSQSPGYNRSRYRSSTPGRFNDRRGRSRTPEYKKYNYRSDYNNNDNYKRNDRYGNNFHRNLTCYNCKQQGHIQRNCSYNTVNHFVNQRPAMQYCEQFQQYGRSFPPSNPNSQQHVSRSNQIPTDQSTTQNHNGLN